MEQRYGIVGVWDTYASIDCLFSGNEGYTESGGEPIFTGLRDPMLDVDRLIGDIGAVYYDVTVAICPNGKCVIQVIQFRTKIGFDKYKHDGITIFDDRQ